MQVFKSITSKPLSYTPFQVKVTRKDDKTYAVVEPRSVIYRSFNLKDMMIWTGYLDNTTRSTIEGLEGSISGHVINGLNEEIELTQDKQNHIIYLKVGIGPSLYATGAEIMVSDLSFPWSGYPEPFEYKPPLEFDENGNLKSNIIYRRQTAAMFPLAYLTNDSSQLGESVMIGTKESAKFYKLIQTIDYNIMMTTFNYDGNPVAYGIPFMNPFLWYSSSSTS